MLEEEQSGPSRSVVPSNGSHAERQEDVDVLSQRVRSAVEVGHVSSPMIDDRAHERVSVDATSQYVCKHFRGADGKPARQDAFREYDYLARLAAALNHEQYLRCPVPVEIERDEGCLWMTFCDGAQLHHALADPAVSLDDDLTHIGEQISRVVGHYISTFDEPYYAMLTWNTLYDPTTKVLSMLDVSDRPFEWCTEHRNSPLETTTGLFLGAGIYHTVRWRRASWRNQIYGRRLEKLAHSYLGGLLSSNHLAIDNVRTVSKRMYDALYQGGGRPRRLWFATAGRAMFRRRLERVLDAK